MSLRRPEISKKDRKEIGKYASWLAPRLGLKDWKILISNQEPEDNDSLAEIKITFGQKLACIRIGASFLRCTQKRQRYVVVHELCHIHTDPISEILNGLESALGPTAFALLSHGVHERDEITVDAFATLLAPGFPTRKEWLRARP